MYRFNRRSSLELITSGLCDGSESAKVERVASNIDNHCPFILLRRRRQHNRHGRIAVTSTNVAFITIKVAVVAIQTFHVDVCSSHFANAVAWTKETEKSHSPARQGIMLSKQAFQHSTVIDTSVLSISEKSFASDTKHRGWFFFIYHCPLHLLHYSL